LRPEYRDGRQAIAAQSAGTAETAGTAMLAGTAGYRTVAIARGKDKQSLAFELGAKNYIDTQAQDPAVRSRNEVFPL
jgi:D-arabinose 1-dehydrogenase-like Zn-dependent alcohol dehydrogenase